MNNKEQDAQWASRKDWDIAICGDYIKTNGGTSGNGFAGAQINTTSTYDALTEAPATDISLIHCILTGSALSCNQLICKAFAAVPATDDAAVAVSFAE